MAKALLIADNGEERDYQIPGGQKVTLVYDDLDKSISFRIDGVKFSDEFRFIDESEDDDGERYLLARMYSPIKNSGLGRAAIEYFIDMTGATIYTRSHDGIVRDDGSHLTGDAPSFVMKMQEEDLIENWIF